MPEFGFLKYFSEFCPEILVSRDIDLDCVVEYFFKLGTLPLKGTAGMSKEIFEPSGDNW